jgi:hypothetical protein
LFDRFPDVGRAGLPALASIGLSDKRPPKRASAKSAPGSGPALRERGLLIVGIDVIDGFLT